MGVGLAGGQGGGTGGPGQLGTNSIETFRLEFRLENRIEIPF